LQAFLEPESRILHIIFPSHPENELKERMISGIQALLDT